MSRRRYAGKIAKRQYQELRRQQRASRLAAFQALPRPLQIAAVAALIIFVIIVIIAGH